MPLTENQSSRESNGSEWFKHKCLNDPTDVSTLWDLRHVALEDEFADVAGAWTSKKQKSYDWLTPSPETHKSFKSAISCLAKQHGETEALLLAYTGSTDVRMRAERLRVEFEALNKQWRRDTKHLSQISKKITHHAFLRIIGMGESVVPLLLEALRDQPAHWFAALRAITNVDPVPEGANPQIARGAWLDWGRKEGLID